MVNQFVYNGKRSYDDYSLIITDTPPFVMPEHDIDFESIAGKNGDVLTDNHRFKNITKEYKVTAIADVFPLPLLAKKIAVWLTDAPNYYILSDTYDPNYFRYACFAGKISVADKLLRLGSATLKFNCKPYKYSFEGQRPIIISSPGDVWNPEDLSSTPYIKISGSGDITLSINSASFAVSGIDEYIEIDGDLMAAFKGPTLQNNKIAFSTFPQLSPGWNSVSWTGNVTSVEIVPRWCAL